ncbi:MAG: hypothetical protein IK102_10495 [Treponema sp.]|nr:hypothetical protein [Treponema sp.]
MKNFISFLILLIFGAFVFFIGWTQIKVKPGKIGIVQSKTGGIDKKLIESGKFSWHKEFLLPTNAQIMIFDYKPYNGTKTVTGNRGQGNYSFTFQISLSYLPELYVDLLIDNKISSEEDFEQYLDGVAAYLAQRATDYCMSRYYKSKDFSPESITISELTTGLAFYKEYPDFDINVLSITDYKLPGDNEVL